MASNHGPTTFQVNAFQTLMLAFQIDDNLEGSAPVSVPGFIPEAPPSQVWTPESPPVQTWVPEDEPGP